MPAGITGDTSLDLNSGAASNTFVVGDAVMVDSSSSDFYNALVVLGSSTLLRVLISNSGGGNWAVMTNTKPVTWGNNDSFMTSILRIPIVTT